MIWGFTDRHSWVPGTFPGTGEALIFDNNYQPKAAYNVLLEALKDPKTAVLPSRSSGSTPADFVYTGLAGNTFNLFNLRGVKMGSYSTLPSSASGPQRFANQTLIFKRNGNSTVLLKTGRY